MIKAQRGTYDVLPQEVYKWHYIEEIIRNVTNDFGFKEIRVPTFEATELFLRGVGETTDIVQKEMYTFEDKGRRSITLRPEGTAGAVRAYLENSIGAEVQPTKLYYLLSIFRYEKPQKGRLREHHQFGVEVFGSQNASVDAEVISLAMNLYSRLGIKNLEVNINNIGCPVCRKEYSQKLKEFFSKNGSDLCDTCKLRLEKNPLRILDCKSEICKDITKNAPKTLDFLCEECGNHFNELQEHLKNMNIPFSINPNIVRGLDYYTKTVFEIICRGIGAQSTVCGGGRYDGLIEELGGKPTPGVGFGMGLERLLLTLEQNGIEIPKPEPIKIFIAAVGESADKEALKILYNLRLNKIACDKDHLSRSVKAQMKYADKLNAKFALVLGDDELQSRKASIKDMITGEKIDINLDNIIEEIKKLK